MPVRSGGPTSPAGFGGRPPFAGAARAVPWLRPPARAVDVLGPASGAGRPVGRWLLRSGWAREVSVAFSGPGGDWAGRGCPPFVRSGGSSGRGSSGQGGPFRGCSLGWGPGRDGSSTRFVRPGAVSAPPAGFTRPRRPAPRAPLPQPRPPDPRGRRARRGDRGAGGGSPRRGCRAGRRGGRPGVVPGMRRAGAAGVGGGLRARAGRGGRGGGRDRAAASGRGAHGVASSARCRTVTTSARTTSHASWGRAPSAVRDRESSAPSGAVVCGTLSDSTS